MFEDFNVGEVDLIHPLKSSTETKDHLKKLGRTKSYMVRSHYVTEYGFVLLTSDVAECLAKELQGKKSLEVAAGTGLLSKALKDLGCNITASDKGGSSFGNYGMEKIWTRDHEGDSLSLITEEFDVVILTWPALGQRFGHDVLKRMKPGQTLIYEGESLGGCCANDKFFQELSGSGWNYQEDLSDELNSRHAVFPGIHDYWRVLQKT